MEPHLFLLQFMAILVGAQVVGKMAGALVLRTDLPTRVAIGLAMIPRGEVGLIFAELGRVAGVFDDEVYAGIVLVIALTTLLAPLIMKTFYARTGARLL